MFKQTTLILITLLFVGTAQISNASEENSSAAEMMHHNMKNMNDGRISLGLSPKMKQHQLTNMRAHLEAVQAIVSLIAEQEFDKASEIAHSQLGLTDEMKKMCNMFNNNDFKELGLEFHKSGDDLGDALKTQDTKKSLLALHNTLGYCTQCHATFKQ